jgi:imidazolonepropionase-like amidohydrolase
MITKTVGDTVDEAVIVSFAMLSVTLGAGALEAKGSPGTRSKAVAILREKLIEAQSYREKVDSAEDAKRPPRDLAKEALVRVLDRETPLLVTAHRAHDILTALRVAREFNIRLVLDGASEAYLVVDEIAQSGYPVMLHPTMKRSYGEAENASMETAARLADAGIPFALQTGYETYVPRTRVLLFEAALAAANGLGLERALRSVTISPAEILGIDKRVGSLEAGKDADLVLFDGDPFEYLTHVTGVIINGVLVSKGDSEWR